MPGERVVLGVAVMLPGGVGRSVILGPVDHARLHRVDELVEAHSYAIPTERVHGVDEDRIPHHPDLEPLEVVDTLDRFLAVVDVARAGVHPAKPDESCGRM